MAPVALLPDLALPAPGAPMFVEEVLSVSAPNADSDTARAYKRNREQ
jgi:hypothetical protein